MRWQASAPANIALIKYMGKNNTGANIPANASFSYTIDHLITRVEIELNSAASDRWEKWSSFPDTFNLDLTAVAQQRYLNHLDLLKKSFKFNGYFTVRSQNNFPHNAGIASSASSFAALTKCACQALAELTKNPLPSLAEQAMLSSKGSGSSCRSFFRPWALWEAQSVNAVNFDSYQRLHHLLIIVDNQAKKVSSSDAHLRVQTSHLFINRKQRAEERLRRLTNFLKNGQWQAAFNVTWQEFWDMHALFETADPPFGYMIQDTLAVVMHVRKHWQLHADGPLVTLDAGPNVHLLFRCDQTHLLEKMSADLSRYSQISSL